MKDKRKQQKHKKMINYIEQLLLFLDQYDYLAVSKKSMQIPDPLCFSSVQLICFYLNKKQINHREIIYTE